MSLLHECHLRNKYPLGLATRRSTGSRDKHLYVGVKGTGLLCCGINRTEQVVGAWAQGTLGQQWANVHVGTTYVQCPRLQCYMWIREGGKPVNLELRWLKAEGTGSHFIQGIYREAGFKHSGRMIMKNWC